MPADFKSHFFVALLELWAFVCHLSPYLIGGILLAAAVNTFASHTKSARLLSTGRWWLLPVSGLAGVISPACTYGTVPMFIAMVKRGAPLGLAATFLVSSSLVNPQMFLLTMGALGIRVALVQAAASLVFAIGMGVLVSRLAKQGVDIEGSELKAARKSESETGDRESGEHHHSHDTMKKAPWPRRFGSNVLDLTEFVGFYFLVGALIAVLISEFLPVGAITTAVGQGKWWAVPFAAVASIPTYVCGGGTIPILAKAQEMGMATGAVLAFLIAGPATRITALSALAILFKKRVVLVYVILVLAFSVLLGATLGHFVQSAPNSAGYFDSGI